MNIWHNVTTVPSDRTNAKEELQEILAQCEKQRGATIQCAQIKHEGSYGDAPTTVLLKQGHTPAQLQHFYNELNFQYSRGYGSQELFGTVWLTNGIWLERWEYDGSEGWEIRQYPPIPNHLIKQ
jgi:hypothetical protein